MDINTNRGDLPGVIDALKLRPPPVSLNILHLREDLANNDFRLTLLPRDNVHFVPVKLTASYVVVLDEHDSIATAGTLSIKQVNSILDYLLDNGLIPEHSDEGKGNSGCIAVLGRFSGNWHCNLGAGKQTLVHLQAMAALLDGKSAAAVKGVALQMEADAASQPAVRQGSSPTSASGGAPSPGPHGSTTPSEGEVKKEATAPATRVQPAHGVSP
jgi:hypothetical protein